MPEPEETRQEVYVLPGESHLVRSPAILRTVLGSCVGITFLIERLGIGALCHPMLPRVPGAAAVPLLPAEGRRYVDFAIRDLAARLDALGAGRDETQVKLFGGADVLLTEDLPGRPTVGKLNAECALRVLQDEGYHVIARRLGGRLGFHIDFDTVTGEVRLRTLHRSMNSSSCAGKWI
jgi:chemotaxis protein CheD